ncbi:CB068 protein, partial [Cnemophilus loriae]|nr:CB068 protein [Cnemophilus loriae]
GTGMEAAAATTTAAPGWRCRPGGRLDMSHGFVRHIRRNQLARYRHRPGTPGRPRGPSSPGRAQRVTRVPQGDSAEEVTRRVCARSPLEPPLRRALCQRVQDELSKRRGTG